MMIIEMQLSLGQLPLEQCVNCLLCTEAHTQVTCNHLKLTNPKPSQAQKPWAALSTNTQLR